MSKSKRDPANAQPITGHTLFPAVVALWFGALFGLGSLAVRPSLLENLIIQSRIDLIVPAAAPPLGITARVLLALGMAALGAVLGIMLSRRLSRPKIETHERKRGAKDLAPASPRVRSRDAHPDAPARRPISAHEELGEDQSLDDPRPVSNGPGMLANRRRALAIIHDEPAFVPLDLAPLPGIGAVEPLDLAGLVLPADPDPQSVVSSPLTPVIPAPTLDWTNAAPVVASPEPEKIMPAPVSAVGRQVFGAAPPEPLPAAPRQIFGLVAEGDHLPQDFVKAAGFQTSVFDTPVADPLFARPNAGPAAAATVAVPEPATVAAATAVQLPSPATLGMTELAARLADSMRLRRERLRANAAPVAVPEIAASQLPDMPAAFAAANEPKPAPGADQAFAVQAALGAPASLDARTAATDVAPVLAQFTAPPLPPATVPGPPSELAIPAAMRPLALDAFLEDDLALGDASLLPPRHIAMPALASQPAPFAPPCVAALASAADALEQFGPEQLGPEQLGDVSLADAAEDNPYASLLAVAPARNAFVRIDDPQDTAGAAIEPVVIFPGQTALVAPHGGAAPASADGGGFRRFDAPASAGQGQPVAAGNTAVTIDPAEAAQALRAALSNLQRISGAA